MYDCDVVNAAVVHFDTWHNRLGHMSVGKMNLVFQHEKFHNNERNFFVRYVQGQNSTDCLFQEAIYQLQAFLSYCI